MKINFIKNFTKTMATLIAISGISSTVSVHAAENFNVNTTVSNNLHKTQLIEQYKNQLKIYEEQKKDLDEQLNKITVLKNNLEDKLDKSENEEEIKILTKQLTDVYDKFEDILLENISISKKIGELSIKIYELN